MDRHRPALSWWVAALPLAFLGYLFVYPLVRILALALGGGAELGDVLSAPSVAGAVWFTIWQAAASTVLAVLVALPLTWVLARFDFPGKHLARAAVTVPFVLPTVVVGSAFVALGVSGSVWAILAAHVFYNLAVVVRTVGSVWSRLDPRLEEAAGILGAPPWRVFLSVTLPLLRPALAAAASIVFLFSFTSFGVVLILGGLRYRTIEVAIYEQARTFLDLPVAGALALIQLVGVGLILAWYGRVGELGAVRSRLVAETAAPHPRRRQRTMLVAIVTLTLGVLAVPPAVLVARGTTGWRVFATAVPGVGDAVGALIRSLTYAAATALIATLIGLLAARVIVSGRGALSRGFDLLLMLPLGTSAVTIGLGFLVALDRPVDLRISPVLIPLAHSLVAIPLVVRAIVPLLRSIRPQLREAAAVLGASPARVWREVDLPIVARAALVGAGFAAAVSLGEFGATAFIVRPESTTLPTLIARLLARPGELPFEGAMALSVVLMVVTGAVMLMVDRLRAGELGTF